MKKIVIISNLYKPYIIGGAERIAESSAEFLKKRGFDVTVISTSPYKGLNSLVPRKELINGIKIYRFFPSNVFFLGNVIGKGILQRILYNIFDIFNFHSYFVIKRILIKEKPDLIFTHNLRGISFLIVRLFKILKIPHVHTLHDYQLICFRGSLFKNKRICKKLCFFCKFYAYINRLLVENPDLIISPSRFVMEQHLKNYFFKCSRQKVIQNGHEINITKKQKHNGVNFLFLGQLERHKGIIFLIDVFKKIHNDNIKLHIVGNGSQLDLAKKMARNDKRIIFYGHIEYNKLNNIFSIIDATFLPSLCLENSPGVVYESLFNHIPVICSNKGGSKELIDEGKTGLVFKGGDSSDFIQKIGIFIKNKARFNNPDHYQRFIKRYSLEEYGKNLIQICKNLD